MSFEKCIEFVLKEEGGFVNDVADPGGATNFGITIGTLSDYRQAHCTIDDVKNLNIDEAKAIYECKYYHPIVGDVLKEGYDLVMFDAAVQHGVRQAIILAQRALNIPQDGIIGAITLRSINSDSEFVSKFQAERTMFYVGMAAFNTFGKGWMRRVIRIAIASST